MRKTKKYSLRVTLIITLALLMMSFGALSVLATECTNTQVTAITNASVKQGNGEYCYVYIDSLEKLSSLMVTVYYDPTKVDVEVGGVFNAAPSLLYDKVVKDDNVQFSYIFDGNGNAEKTQLFYFEYQILAGAENGEAYFDIVVSEAYDSALTAMPVVGSRCEFSIFSNSPTVSHSYTRQVIADAYKKSDATCTTPAVYYYCCETCGARGDATFMYGSFGHTYEFVWSSDVAVHWHKCSKCGDVTDVSFHIPGAAATETSAQTCVVCGYVIASALGHTHQYSAIWLCDAGKHWQECSTCGARKNEAAHTPAMNAAETTAQICTVCQYVVKDVTEWKNSFTDVKRTDWYFEAIKYVCTNKLMNGTSISTFAPNDKLTRAMFVTVLYRLEKEPNVNSSLTFDDVDKNTWYTNAVIWARENSIVNGISENEFAPNASITREQIATIMYRYAVHKGYDVSVGENTNLLFYKDAGNISEFASFAMKYAVGSGLINGKTETTLNPKDNATRAEIATVLQRFVEKTTLS